MHICLHIHVCVCVCVYKYIYIYIYIYGEMVDLLNTTRCEKVSGKVNVMSPLIAITPRFSLI